MIILYYFKDHLLYTPSLQQFAVTGKDAHTSVDIQKLMLDGAMQSNGSMTDTQIIGSKDDETVPGQESTNAAIVLQEINQSTDVGEPGVVQEQPMDTDLEIVEETHQTINLTGGQHIALNNAGKSEGMWLRMQQLSII